MANSKMPNVAYPIADYDDLIKAVQLWADRDDDEFVNQIPNFIDFAQKELFRTGRYNFNAKEAYVSVVNGIINLPTDWMQTDYLIMSNGWRELRETSRAEVLNHMKQGYTLATTPEIVYTRMQDRLLLSPIFSASLPVTNSDGTVSYDENTILMGYWFDPNRPSEGGSSPVDYLIQIAPDLLLNATLGYAMSFISDNDAASSYIDRTNNILNSMDEQNKMQDNTGVKVIKLANIREYW